MDQNGVLLPLLSQVLAPTPTFCPLALYPYFQGGVPCPLSKEYRPHLQNAQPLAYEKTNEQSAINWYDRTSS